MVWTDEELNDLVAAQPYDLSYKLRLLDKLIEVRARYEARITELEEQRGADEWSSFHRRFIAAADSIGTGETYGGNFETLICQFAEFVRDKQEVRE